MNDTLPDDNEIKSDILDTEMEIEDIERKIKGYELIGDKLSMFRADGLRFGIKERRAFITKLQGILTTRQVEGTSNG